MELRIKVDFRKFPHVRTVLDCRQCWHSRKTCRALRLLQIRPGGFRVARQRGILIAGVILPSAEEEDELDGMTKVLGILHSNSLKLLWTVRFERTPEQLSLLPVLSM